MHFCKRPTNHIADDIGGVVSKTLYGTGPIIVARISANKQKIARGIVANNRTSQRLRPGSDHSLRRIRAA